MFRSGALFLLVAICGFGPTLTAETQSSGAATALNAGDCAAIVEVTDSHNSPVSGVHVSLRGKSRSPSPTQFHLFEDTDAKGHVRFAGLPEGQMTVSVDANGKKLSRKFTTSGTCNFTKVGIVIPGSD